MESQSFLELRNLYVDSFGQNFVGKIGSGFGVRNL